MPDVLGLLLLLSHFSHVRLCNPIDGSPPGSAIPGILQARTLEWVAISFSNAWKWKVKVKSLSRVRLFRTPWTDCSLPGFSLSMGSSKQECWSGVPLPALADLSNLGIESAPPASADGFFTYGATKCCRYSINLCWKREKLFQPQRSP